MIERQSPSLSLLRVGVRNAQGEQVQPLRALVTAFTRNAATQFRGRNTSNLHQLDLKLTSKEEKSKLKKRSGPGLYLFAGQTFKTLHQLHPGVFSIM